MYSVTKRIDKELGEVIASLRYRGMIGGDFFFLLWALLRLVRVQWKLSNVQRHAYRRYGVFSLLSVTDTRAPEGVAK